MSGSEIEEQGTSQLTSIQSAMAQINPEPDTSNGSTRKRMSRAQREQRRLSVAERLLSGASQTQIAHELGMSDGAVFSDVQVLESRWAEQANELIDRKKARYEAKLRRLEFKLNEYIAKSESENNGQANPRYVELLGSVLDRFAKLYGLAQEGAGQASAVTVVAGIDLAAVLGQRPALVDMTHRQTDIHSLENVATNEPGVQNVATNEVEYEDDDDYEEEAAPVKKEKRQKPERPLTYSEKLGLPSLFDGLKPKSKRKGPNHPENNEPAPPAPETTAPINPHPEYHPDPTPISSIDALSQFDAANAKLLDLP